MKWLGWIRLLPALLFVACVSLQSVATGQEAFPAKPVRIVVPFSAGGISDVVARTIAADLAATWNQSVVVENRPGAGGITGVNVLTSAAPDGYTLLLMNPAGLAIIPSLFKDTQFDVAKDIVPVSLVAQSPYVMVVNPAVPANDIGGLIALGKERRGGLNYGSGGNGTVSHLAGIVFQDLAGITWEHIPYKGDSAVLTDLLAGRIDIVMMTLPTALPQLRSGKLKALAVTGAQRAPELPEVPTVIESGLAGFEYAAWQGIYAPAGTPPSVIESVQQAVASALRKPTVLANLKQLGLQPASIDPGEFRASLQRDVAKWAEIARKAGVEPR